jgi:DNA polymerase-3 subunit gamma/tau
MAKTSSPPETAETAAARPREYVVVARRYRPQLFEELVGQEHIARALSNAISTSRVGHAYLFTGARGVGKTSTARIFAKALNCARGPTPSPCNQCDLCRAISSGDDVDVLEIDGASNRGIDEIRQLRQNVNVRPSRARFKIYIIDEVHMLTREAFNALLKTLEEPPEHVKFIFCTTEPTKIPITILSRCQRFDFAGIRSGPIAQRLQAIVEAEGVQAEPEVLEILARRAAGSMRDGQSLLEQLLSFAPGRITAADVHGMLGTANDERLGSLAGDLAAHRPAAALAELDAAVQEGVDPAQLLEQLFGYLRDCLVAAAGCPAEVLLYASPASYEQVTTIGKQFGTGTLLAATQILDHSLARLRYSTQTRILAELALVRICDLENLDELSALVAQLRGGTTGEACPAAPAGQSSRRPVPPESAAATSVSFGGGDRLAASPRGGTGSIESSTVPPGRVDPAPSAEGAKKKSPLTGDSVNVPSPELPQTPVAITPENVGGLWSQALAKMSGFAAEHAKRCSDVAILAPNHLVILFPPAYTLAKSVCEQPEQLARFEQALAAVTGQAVRIEFRQQPGPTTGAAEAGASVPPVRVVLPHQRLMQAAQHPMVKLAAELFGAHPVRVDEPAAPPAAKEARE